MSDASTRQTITLTGYELCREAFRSKTLRQALYDEGEVVMADVLVNLHGAEHRDRRKLENRLFRRDTHVMYEKERFPPIVEATLAPHVDAGSAELVSLSHQMMMNLAASAAGVDRPLGTPEETDRLYGYMMRFIEGATLAHYSGDREAKRAEVREALAAFEVEFLEPSMARRRDALIEAEAGDIAEEELPRDVLTVLMRNQDDLHLPPDVVLRETCFFLLAGAHTSATAFVRTLDHIFAGGDEMIARATDDMEYLQRCVHETVRLQPSSPVAMRWATEPVELSDGTNISAGDKVVLDLMSANRDASIFGPTADSYDPDREVEGRVGRWGLSFGLGMHACIGQEIAAGVDSFGRVLDDTHLYGLVPVAAQSLLRSGGRADPGSPAVLDPQSDRGYWSRYPVVFGGAPSS